MGNLIIIISHLHKDHYADLTAIAQGLLVYKRYGLLKENIKVYIPKEDGEDYNYIKSLEKYPLEIIEYDETLEIIKNDLKITCSLNPHDAVSFGFRIESENIILAYSGDTGYKNNTLDKISKNADLFICESTYLKRDKRIEDFHLYTYEAALIAKENNVKKLALTHFWPENEKYEYALEAKEIFDNTIYLDECNELLLRR